jgi:hypothetical protein
MAGMRMKHWANQFSSPAQTRDKRLIALSLENKAIFQILRNCYG